VLYRLLEVAMRTLVMAVVVGMTWQVSGGIAGAQTSPASAETARPPLADDWRRSGGPLLFGGASFYPSGPTVFFEASVMVRSGSVDGVPIYIDATHDPANVVYVPVAGGLLRPYERRRADQIADTLLQTAAPPPAIVDAGVPPDVRTPPAARVDSTTPRASTAGNETTAVETARRPTANRGIWIEYGGRVWLAAGAGGPAWPGRFSQIGIYHGFPVYQEAAHTDRIYVPSVPGGPVARYSLSDERATQPIE
jgi:hypothetical protein